MRNGTGFKGPLYVNDVMIVNASGQIVATLDVTAAGVTTGIALALDDNASLTTGQIIKIAHTTSVIADGGSLLKMSSSGVDTGGATVGTLLDLKSTGQLAGTLARLDTILTTGTGLSIIGTGIMTTTGNLLTVTGNAATTAAGLVRINGDGLTSGIGLVVTSASTGLTGAGRLLRIDHTGNAGVSGIVAEIASAAADETVILQVTGSAALAAGKALNVSVAALTTGTGIDCSDNTALTTGVLLNISSNSADATARFLTHIRNQHASAIGVVPLKITNAAVTGTGSKFVSLIRGTEGTKVFTLWLSIDATTPNGNLTGVVGDICVNGPSGRSFYCTGTTNWTASNA